MKKWMSERKGIIALCVLYGVVSALLFSVWRPHVMYEPDSESYISLARNILRDRSFSRDGVIPEHFRTPGYPVFLAGIYALGGGDGVAIAVQIILVMLSIYLMHDVLTIGGVPRKFALLGASIPFLDIATYQYSHCILSECLFAALLVMSLWFFARYENAGRRTADFIGCAVTLHAALLVRPILLYFIMLLCLLYLALWLTRRAKFMQFAVMILGFALVFGGWSCRNYAHSSVFTYSTVRDFNLLYFDASVLAERVEGVSDGRAFMEARFDERYPGFAGDGAHRNMNDPEMCKRYAQVGGEYIAAHPGRYVIQNARGLLLTMLGPSRDFIRAIFPEPRWLSLSISLAYSGLLGLLYALYAIGGIRRFKKLSPVNLYIFFMSAYLAAASASLGYARFRTSFILLIVVGAVLAWRGRASRDHGG